MLETMCISGIYDTLDDSIKTLSSYTLKFKAKQFLFTYQTL